MTFLDFLGMARDYAAKRRSLMERLGKVLSSCRKREECLARVFRTVSEFLERDPEENVRIVRSVVSSLPPEYAGGIAKLIEAFEGDVNGLGNRATGDSGLSDLGRVVAGDIACSDLEGLVYMANESRDFVAVALTLAILERAGEMRECSVELARSLLALIRRLYEGGGRDLVAPILNKYGVRIYVHKSGEEIKGVKVFVGNNFVADLTDVLSLVYSDVNAIMELGGARGPGFTQ